ncbi:TBC domain-containing protein kinase-like protein [Daphnia pulex]|uniref:TBC domain-containing protein kinase-like protein n=1 Tax=Daphnia pulex TaxID=6669 RepID=UPI001EDD60F9|nr:TBC domain-containing protein kinase-like protein [Daphnia pulex]
MELTVDCCDVFSNNSNKDPYNIVESLKKICTNFRCRNPTLLDKAGLGVSTFCAANHPVESCGSNGLPLTPNSVQILGKFQSLSQLEHPNLCAYVEICRIQHERVIVVAEHYSTSLQTLILKKKIFGLDLQIHITRSIIEALRYLHSKNVVHQNFHSKNILISSEGRVKLSAYGIYYMTQSSTLVSFPIGYPKYLAPEVLLLGYDPSKSWFDKSTVCDETLTLYSSKPKSDIWSLGMILLEMALGMEFLSESRSKLWNTLRKVMSWIHARGSAVERIVAEAEATEQWKSVQPELKEVIESCLQVLPENRPTADQLLKYPLFGSRFNVPAAVFKFPAQPLQPDLLRIHQLMSKLPLSEVYHFWHLVGGDVEAELRKAGILRNKPAIFSLPCLVLEEGESFGQTKDRTTLFDDSVVEISLEALLRRLQHLPSSVFDPLMDDVGYVLFSINDHQTLREAAQLPLVIKEKDIDYQLYRIVMFDKQLRGYPLTRQAIVKEAREDVPPFCRARVWAALLKVDPSYSAMYAAIDKETSHSSDRQIEVDIPRCHQYMDLLASPEGHAKFKRILKAWVNQHPQYVYWQGLDSLTAPFLLLHFNDEALAYACLAAFIPKYLNNFFWKDNSSVIQEYLAKFSHLIAFHDPVLRNHLDCIGFVPDLYAIPWFLTMFAHVFPLHKIFHLWDKLLLGNSSFPLCIGLAVLQQLRESLLESGFNECILLFSDMPEIDIERCLKDSIEIFCSTPQSVTFRQHEPPSVSPKGNRSFWDFSLIGSNCMDDDEEIDTSSLAMDSIPVATLKSERCPRISAEDFIELLDLNHKRFARPKMVVVDVRNANKFQNGAVPGSINLPYQTCWTTDGTLIPCEQLEQLDRARGKIVCVIGSSCNDLGLKFSEILLDLQWPRVCTLHKGFDVLLKTQILVVPAAVGMC